MEVHCGPQSFDRRAEPCSAMAVLLQGLAGRWGSWLASPGRAAQVHRAETLGLSGSEGGSDLRGLLGEALLPVNVADAVISSPEHVYKPLQLSSCAAPELNSIGSST